MSESSMSNSIRSTTITNSKNNNNKTSENIIEELEKIWENIKVVQTQPQTNANANCNYKSVEDVKNEVTTIINDTKDPNIKYVAKAFIDHIILAEAHIKKFNVRNIYTIKKKNSDKDKSQEDVNNFFEENWKYYSYDSDQIKSLADIDDHKKQELLDHFTKITKQDDHNIGMRSDAIPIREFIYKDEAKNIEIKFTTDNKLYYNSIIAYLNNLNNIIMTFASPEFYNLEVVLHKLIKFFEIYLEKLKTIEKSNNDALNAVIFFREGNYHKTLDKIIT